MKRKFAILFLAIFTFTSVFVMFPRKANATLIVHDPLDMPNDIMTTIESIFTTIETTISAIATDGMWMNEVTDRYLVPILKVAAIEMMNQIISNIVSSGNNGKPMFVTDWNDYLYTSTQKNAKVYMNSFFNSVSAGRLSSLNYEGAGQSYDNYLKKQAEITIYGSTKQTTTTINNYVSDPRQDLFSKGNFKAFSAFLSCSNNPYCYSLSAENAYEKELDRLKTIAIKEANTDGYLPKKVNGKIVTPGSQFQSAMEGIDQMANNWFMNATTSPELIKALAGTVVTKVTKSLIEGIASS